MKIQADRRELLDALTAACKAVPGRATIPGHGPIGGGPVVTPFWLPCVISAASSIGFPLAAALLAMAVL